MSDDLSDIVRAALEKAAEAAWLIEHPRGNWIARLSWLSVPIEDRNPRWHPHNYEDHEDVTRARKAAADAVAAFLRAIPGGTGFFTMDAREDLAAAVDAANRSPEIKGAPHG
jgi:hypothetical protein